MTIRPILFSGPMVRALLDGRKTQTRRVLIIPEDYSHAIVSKRGIDGPRYVHLEPADDYVKARQASRTCATGDLLYVRETHAILPPFAAGEEPTCIQKEGWPNKSPATVIHKWKPCIHMPRWASRLTLKVTDVRVQRLQKITQDDVLAEGAPIDPYYKDTTADQSSPPMIKAGPATWQSPRLWFHRLWDSLNEKRGFGWDVNPWVVAVTFEVHRCNVDSFKEQVAA